MRIEHTGAADPSHNLWALVVGLENYRHDAVTVEVDGVTRVLEQIAGSYATRGSFLTELTLDPPRATSAEAGRPHLDEDYLGLSTIHSAKGQELLAKPTNDIDAALALFSRDKTAFVGYDVCSAPLYLFMTNCCRTLQQRVLHDSEFSELKMLFERSISGITATQSAVAVEKDLEGIR